MGDSPLIEETAEENIAPESRPTTKSKGIKAFLTDLPKQISETSQQVVSSFFAGDSGSKSESDKELRHAREFLNYFANTHSERQLDSWIKVYLPAVRAGEIYNNPKLK